MTDINIKTWARLTQRQYLNVTKANCELDKENKQQKITNLAGYIFLFILFHQEKRERVIQYPFGEQKQLSKVID